MVPRIQYCTTSDGVSIAYTTAGEGRPLISMPVPGFSHAELNWQMYAAIQGPIAENFQLVTYDSRGTGLSDRTATDFSIDAMLRDLDAVVERSGFERFTLVAWIAGAPIAFKYAATHPDRVSHLVIGDGWASFRDIADSPAYKAGLSLVDGDWVLFTDTFAQVLWAYQAPEFGRLFAQFIRACVNQETMRAIWDSWTTYDSTQYLAQITIPTCIATNKNGRWYGPEVGQRLAAAIPNSRLTLIDDITYAPMPDLIDAFVDEGADSEPRKATASGSAFRTVVFTDLVGHTEMMSRLGDEKGREVLREHERIARLTLAANGGTEVKTMGDGFMASFSSVTRAVECAIALQRAFAGREGEPLSVRVGINAGEPIEEDGDLFGATVILASRIAAKADGGEILVADTVRGLCSGKGFLFADRGEFVAKGYEEPMRVYEVNWRE